MRIAILLFFSLLILSCMNSRNSEGVIGLVDYEKPQVKIISPVDGTECMDFVYVEVEVKDVSPLLYLHARLSTNSWIQPSQYSFERLSQDGYNYVLQGDISHQPGTQMRLVVEAKDNAGNIKQDSINIKIIPIVDRLTYEDEARDIEEDINGIIWISASDLYAYNPETEEFWEASSNSIGSFAIDPNTNYIWHCRSEYSHVYLVCRDNGTVIEEIEINRWIDNICITPDGTICGLYDMMHGDNFCTYSNGAVQLPLGHYNDFNDIAIDHDGIIWLLSDDFLGRWDNEQLMFIDIPVNTNTQHLEIDFQNNIWVKGGDHILKYDRNSWEHFEMPEQDYYYAVKEEFTVDQDGNVWINGMRTVKVRNGEILREYPFMKYYEPNKCFADSYGYIYLNGGNGSLYILNQEGFRQ